ncbi:MAG: DnaD domain protein [Oscillospiraceae bacterium]|nr:DnaD domain protein [Oscillospiraceae bacterium]
MNYKINWTIAEGAFAVPDCVVDNYIKLASGKAVKVLMYILRHKTISEENTEEIAASLDKKMSAEDIEDALSYWEQVGVICRTDKPAPAVKPVSEPVKADEASPEPVKVQTITPQKSMERSTKMLTPKEIAARASESNEIGGLLAGAEVILGRVLTHTEQRTFIWIYDFYAMGADIILMLADFCKSINKANIAYIEKVAASWHEKEITTHQQADAEIRKLQSYFSLEGQVVSRLGLNRSLTKKEREFLNQWAQYGTTVELIEYAHEKTVNNTGKVSFNYMNKIISEWYKNGLRTIQEIDSFNQKRFSPSPAPAPSQQENTQNHSYDLNLLLENALAVNNDPKE